MRRVLSVQQQEEAALGLLNQIKKVPSFFSCKCCGIYLASDGEINPINITRELLDRGIILGLPVVDPIKPHSMIFRHYDNTTSLIANRFGILEPDDTNRPIELAELDALIVPLVAFDTHCNRLGMGGGYYDHTLQQICSLNKKILTIGVAHDLQLVKELPTQSWDQPLDLVVTPSKIFYPN